MSTDDNNNDTNEPKIDYTVEFDLNATAIKPIEEHPLFPLAKDEKEGPASDRQKSALEGIHKTTMDDESFFRKEIPPRRSVLGSWFREGSLGFIFGRRGAGKTWFAWDMAISISKGVDYGPWKCEMPRKTLYVDGEMPLRSMQERLKLLNPNPTGNLFIMSRERLMDEARMLLNLCESCWQEALLTYCVEEKIKVVFLDNLSSLCWGMKENEADSWEQVPQLVTDATPVRHCNNYCPPRQS